MVSQKKCSTGGAGVTQSDGNGTSDGKVRFRTSVRTRTGPDRTSISGSGSGVGLNRTDGSGSGSGNPRTLPNALEPGSNLNLKFLYASQVPQCALHLHFSPFCCSLYVPCPSFLYPMAMSTPAGGWAQINHLPPRGCKTLGMVFMIFVNGVNAGASIPLFCSSSLEGGPMCQIEYVRSALRFFLLCAYVLCHSASGDPPHPRNGR